MWDEVSARFGWMTCTQVATSREVLPGRQDLLMIPLWRDHVRSIIRRSNSRRTLRGISGIFHESLSMTSSVPSPAAARPQRFATTRWSLIQQARQGQEGSARVALEELCQAYWLPAYAFMRRQTRDLHEAQDWTQGFFASLLSRDAFAQLTPERGRFRSFLLAAARHFASNERDKKNAIVRGGHVVLQSLDYEAGEQRLAKELATTAEGLFERQWAHAVLERVLQQLREEYDANDRRTLFDLLGQQLAGTVSEGVLIKLAETLSMSPEACRVALHRMRKRYRFLLRQEIGQTTNTPDEIDDEIRYLFRILAHP